MSPLPHPASDALLARRDRVVARGAARLTELVIARGEGAHVVDVDGHRYLDLSSGIAVTSLGHAHPEVVAAVREQAGALLHACGHIVTYPPYVELCERLTALFPHGGEARAFLASTGAEAVENAVKVARQVTGRPAILTYTEAFHGRTLLALTLTSKTALKQGVGPFAPEVYRLPFPHAFRRGDGLSPEAFVARELARLEELFVTTVRAEQVAAVIIEPVLGEGGFVPCPPEYLRGLRRLTREHGILLIVDEVQTGLCRTGRWAGYQHADIEPDLTCWAKALGSGLPIAAVLGSAAVMDRTLPGTLGGTFVGNPVSCAAALATLRVMERDDLAARAVALGAVMERALRRGLAGCAAVGEIRGLGALWAVELCEGGDPARPLPELATRALARARERGVLALPAGVHGNVIRIIPPLTIDEGALEQGVGVLAEAIRAA